MPIDAKRRSYTLTERYGSSERLDVAPEVVERVRVLYDAGRYLDAYEVAGAAGPLQAWRGAEALELGSRLAGNVGGERIDLLLSIRGHRAHPHDARIALHHGFHLAVHRGPMAAWNHLVRFERREPVAEGDLAEFLGLRARIAGAYRDFTTADALLARAVELSPRSPWLLVEKASVLLSEERREQALGALDQALILRPWFRPAVQFRARLLHVLGRLEEAVDLLTRAAGLLQSYAVVGQLVELKRESDDEGGILELLARLEALTPLASAAYREWIAVRRADAFYLAGDLASAATEAEKVHHPSYDQLARRLRAASGGEKRVRLPFRFIPQGHLTCGPATLAAIAQHWEMTVTQDSIVEAIAYSGTYDHAERRWCETHGFAAREFKVTWDAARLLLDQDVPFALATVDATSGHLQAVIGYDTMRETLFIQDPSEPHFREVPAGPFLERYRLTGPRGMAVVPAARRSWLNAQPLPEADLFDLDHVVQTALGAHRREDALAALERIESKEPGGRLALLGRLALSAFDGDTVERLQIIDRLLALFDDDQRLLAWRLALMRESGRGEERLVLLRRAVRLDEAHPHFTRELATELGVDIRNHAEVGRLLWKAHRLAPLDATALTALADWQLRKHRDEAALDFHRFAASLADKDESFARNWFNAASAFGRSAEALAWLRWRFAAFGNRSGAPAVTLAECLARLSRTDEAVRVMAEGISRRPEDGELLVQAARLDLHSGALDRAEMRLEAAEGKCPPRMWRRASAALRQGRGDRPRALKAWQEVLAQEPLALDAHQAVFEQLACLEGEAAALGFLESACARFPHHYGLNEFRVLKLRALGPDATVAAARRLVETHPRDPRARRMLAGVLEEGHRPEEALAFARSACEIAPDDAVSRGIHGKVLAALGRGAEAAEEIRAAVRQDVNYPWTWESLLNLMPSTAERRSALDFVRAEMSRQVVQGLAVKVYSGLAQRVFEPSELKAQLHELWRARPDLWEGWSTLITRELDSGHGEEAERLAVDAVTRFPLVSGAWRDLSSVQRSLGNNEEARRAIRRALDLNPEWSTAWLELGRLLEEGGQPGEAIAALRAAVKRNPLAVDVRLQLAELCWRADQREEAWALAAAAAEMDPSISEVWERLRAWATTLRREEALVALARTITRDRPGEARSWLILANVLPASAIDEELAAYDAAIFRNPRMGEAYDLKAAALARLGRLDAAEAVIRQGPWGNEIPGPLKGRLAWFRAVRGDLAGAVAEMSPLLERNQDYVWGWERLCEWAERTEDLPTWERAAQALMRLVPRHPLGYCHAAAVEFRKEKTGEAAALLTRALELEPGHGYAARKLLEYHWSRRDPSALEALPSLLLDGGQTGWVSVTARVLAAALRGDESQLRRHLDRLVCAPDDVQPLAAFVEHQLTRELPQFRPLMESVLDDCVGADRIGPSFATVWVGVQARGDRWECWERFGAWSERMGEPAREAIARFLDLAGASPQGAGSLPRLIQAQRPLLRADTLLWGKVGWALTKTARHREAVDWLAGGVDRPDARGWMLANQVHSLKALGLSAEASAISAAVLRRGLHDQTWGMHVSQAAFGAARGGDLAEARAILALPLPEPPKGDWAVLRGLGESLVRVLSTPPPGARAVVREELARLRQLTSTNPSPTSTLVAEYASAIAQMGHHAGSWVPPWKTRYPVRRANASAGLRTDMDLWRWFWPVFIVASLGLFQQCERTFNTLR